MRQELLFRGTRVDNHEFVKGSFVKTLYNSFIIPKNDETIRAMDIVSVIPETVVPFVRNDKNGNRIFKGDKFKFKFLRELNNPIELIGSFDWCQDELRYEIDIWDHEKYVCLSYVDHGVMFDFELLP